MKEKISVIVPIYNSEKYLNGCLDSILNSTYKNLEILLINDGSTDSSLDICKEYEKSDSRIRIISQENRGLSAARNTGIDNASSNYYVFIDSDDEIMPTMIEELYDLLIKKNADIAMCNFYYHRLSEQVKIRRTKTFSGNSKFQLLEQNYLLITTVQWNKIFRKEIFDDLRYPEGLYHEDEYIIHHELDKAKKIAFTNRKLYHYFNRESSITNRKDLKRNYDVVLAYVDKINFFRKKEMYHYSMIFMRYLAYQQQLANRNGDAPNSDIYLPKINALFKQMLTIHTYLKKMGLEVDKKPTYFEKKKSKFIQAYYDFLKKYNNEF